MFDLYNGDCLEILDKLRLQGVAYAVKRYKEEDIIIRKALNIT